MLIRPHRPWLVAAAVMMLAAGCNADTRPPGRPTAPSSTPRQDQPSEPTRRLSGAPLTGATGLEFLVGADPPVIVDSDRSGLRPLTGLPRGRDRSVAVERVGARVMVQTTCAGCGTSELFVSPPGSLQFKKIGAGADFIPSMDGRGIWMKRYEEGTRCTLTQLWVDGRTRTAARGISCDRHPVAETALGLLWSGSEEGADAVIERQGGGPEVFRAPQIHAVVGRTVLSDDGTAGPFTLTDVPAKTRTPIPKPTSIGGASQGLLAPDGRTLAISFDHPAWPGPRQRMDTWVLDLPTKRWQHLPAMPVNAALKSSGMTWTPDGRLVLLGSFDGVGDVLALWRPGETRWALRDIGLPASGANGFILLRPGDRD